MLIVVMIGIVSSLFWQSYIGVVREFNQRLGQPYDDNLLGLVADIGFAILLLTPLLSLFLCRDNYLEHICWEVRWKYKIDLCRLVYRNRLMDWIRGITGIMYFLVRGFLWAICIIVLGKFFAHQIGIPLVIGELIFFVLTLTFIVPLTVVAGAELELYI
jgi:hypothetical protein